MSQVQLQARAKDTLPFGFDLLFDDLARGEFLATYFPTKAVISHSSRALVALSGIQIASAEPLDIIRDFSAAPIRLWIERESREVSLEDACMGFASGGAIYIPNADRVYTELGSFLAALCGELGIPREWGSCSVFLSRSGAEVPLHFDHDFGFNMLLRGHKRWSLAANEDVVWPTVGFDASKEPMPALKRYLTKPLPNKMPENSVTVDTCAGAVCFLPRGHWHTTFAYEDCVALDFAIDPPCWAEYISAIVRDQLLAQENGRQSVLGLSPHSSLHSCYERRREAVLISALDLVRIVNLWP